MITNTPRALDNMNYILYYSSQVPGANTAGKNFLPYPTMLKNWQNFENRFAVFSKV